MDKTGTVKCDNLVRTTGSVVLTFSSLSSLADNGYE